MGVPSEYDHPAQAIFDRSLINLRHMERCARNGEYVFEFTALVNSLLGIVVHPWDQIIDKNKLDSIDLTDPKIASWGFPVCRTSKPYKGTLETDTSSDPIKLGKMLRPIRNGIAHGNIELLDLDSVLRRQLNRPIQTRRTNDIVALEVWNCRPHTTLRTWGTVLSIRELRLLISGIERLVKDPTREYWSAHALQVAAERPVMRLA